MGLFMRHLKLLMKLNLFSSMNSYRTIAREGMTLFPTLSHLASLYYSLGVVLGDRTCTFSGE